MIDESTLGRLGPPDDISDSQFSMVYRWPDRTELLVAKKFPGCFGGPPDMVWGRRLSNEETQQMLDNPYRIFTDIWF